MKKAVIFDFDGTLANTAVVLQKVYNQMAKEKGWPIMKPKDYVRLRKGTLRQAVEWAGVRPWQLPFLLNDGRKRFLQEIDEVSLFTGMDTVIHELSRSGWDLFVLSQNGEQAVKTVLKKEKLNTKLTVLPRASFFGKHRNLKKFLKQRAYAPENIWMIGDEVRDVVASNKVGINSIAVTWGLQDKAILSPEGPTALATRPNDIIRKLC